MWCVSGKVSTSTRCLLQTLDNAVATPAQRSIDDFVARHPGAVVKAIANGGYSVRLDEVPLDAAGWSKATCSIAFLIPAGFPVQRPDCFWADADLRLRSGGMPSNSGFGAQHPFYPGLLWFSYHPTVWNIRDTVETYWHLIQSRLLQAR